MVYNIVSMVLLYGLPLHAAHLSGASTSEVRIPKHPKPHVKGLSLLDVFGSALGSEAFDA